VSVGDAALAAGLDERFASALIADNDPPLIDERAPEARARRNGGWRSARRCDALLTRSIGGNRDALRPRKK